MEGEGEERPFALRPYLLPSPAWFPYLIHYQVQLHLFTGPRAPRLLAVYEDALLQRQPPVAPAPAAGNRLAASNTPIKMDHPRGACLF